MRYHPAEMNTRSCHRVCHSPFAILCFAAISCTAPFASGQRLISNGFFFEDIVWTGGTAPGPGSVAIIDSDLTAMLNFPGTGEVAGLNVSLGRVAGSGSLIVGNLQLSGGEVDVNLTVNQALTWTGGKLGRTTGPANATWSGAGAKELTNIYTNTGTLTVSGTNIDSANDEIENGAGRVIEIAETGNVFVRLQPFSNGGIIQNRAGATVRKTASGAAPSHVDWALNNEGTLEVLVGTLNLAQGGTHRGTANVAAGATLELSDGVHFLRNGGVFNGPGLVLVSGTADLNASDVTGAFQVNAPLLQTGGSIFSGGSSPALNINQQYDWLAGVLGAVATTVNLNGPSNWSSGGEKLITGTTDNLRNFGTLTISGANIVTNFFGRGFGNSSGGIVDFVADGVHFAVGGATEAGTILNSVGGIVRKSAGSGVSTIQWNLDNLGAIEIQTGTLQFQTGRVTLAGNTSISIGAVLDFNSSGSRHALVGGGSITGSGLVLVSGATVELTGEGGFTIAAPTSLTSGILGERFDSEVRLLNLSGGLDWTGGTLGASNSSATTGSSVFIGAPGVVSTWSGAGLKTIASPVSLAVNRGIVNLTGTSVRPARNGTGLTNTAGGIFRIAGDGVALDVNGSAMGRFTNDMGGVFQKSTGTGTSTIRWIYDNFGTTQVDIGTLQFTQNTAFAGTTTIASGAVLELASGTHLFSAGQTTSGAGILRIGSAIVNASGLGTPHQVSAKTVLSSGTININQADTALHLAGGLDWDFGNIGGIGMLQISGNSIWSTTGIKTINGTVRNSGQIQLTGTFLTNAASTNGIVNQTGAQFIVSSTGNAMVNNGLSNGRFENGVGATFTRMGNAGTSNIAWTFLNSGTIEVPAGTLNFAAGAGGTGGFLGGHIGNISPGLPGSVTFSSGDYILENGGSVGNLNAFTVQGANLELSLGATYTIHSKARLTSGSLGAGGSDTSTLRLLGGLDWTGGTLGSMDGTKIEIAGAMNWSGGGNRIVGDRPSQIRLIGQTTLTSSVRNSEPGTGLMNDAGGRFVLSADAASLVNNGANVGTFVNGLGAIFSKTSPGTNSIAWDFQNDGFLEITSGVVDFLGKFEQSETGSTKLTNNARIRINNQSFELAGDYAGNGIFDTEFFAHLLGRISPGESPGTLEFTGTLDLSPGSNLNFELGQTSDLIRVGNELRLDGVLHIDAAAGFAPGPYVLFDYEGAFTDDGLAFGQMPDGFEYALSNDVANTQVVLTITSIPEPSGALLMLIGVASLLQRRFRRRA